MDHSNNLSTLAGRLATFEQPQQLSKRRASSTKKKTPNAASWPHSTPTPNELAKAGFYYRPTPNSADSVTCFLCNKALDGWDANDNPALEHLAHVPECGWAINICIEQRSQVENREEEDPLSEKMMEARRATFKDAWPHENKKGWKCKVQKMVEAGWTYTPIPEADDCVSCFYCSVSLDGWEPKDDPWKEHEKRAPDCPFFQLIEESTKLRKAAKGKKGRTSRASKSSRLSTQSTATAVSDVPPLASPDDLPKEDEDTVLTTESTAPKATKGKKKGVKAKPASKKGLKAARNQDASMIDSTIAESTMADDGETTMQESSQPNRSAAPRTGRTRKGTMTKEDESSADMSQIPANMTGSSQTTVQKRGAAKSDRVNESEPSNAIDAETSQTAATSKQKPKRGKKRTSDGVEKVDISETNLEEPPRPARPQARGAKKGRAAKKDSIQPHDPIEHNDEPRAEAEEPEKKALQKRASKSKKAKNDNDQLRPEYQSGMQYEFETTQPLAGAQQAGISPKVQQSKVERRQLASVKESTPQKAMRAPTASCSPQSSDAENRPPSSRPSVKMPQPTSPPERAQRTPLAVTTPEASPSKRNVIAGGLKSTFPWKEVDLETIFLPSPSSRALEGQEGVQLHEVLERLSSPEKKMTVEEWILWNAQRAEVQLKNECERLIGIFEREGVRALRVIEGVECD